MSFLRDEIVDYRGTLIQITAHISKNHSKTTFKVHRWLSAPLSTHPTDGGRERHLEQKTVVNGANLSGAETWQWDRDVH